MRRDILAKHVGLFETATIHKPCFCKTHSNIILPYTTTFPKMHYSIIIFKYNVCAFFIVYACFICLIFFDLLSQGHWKNSYIPKQSTNVPSYIHLSSSFASLCDIKHYQIYLKFGFVSFQNPVFRHITGAVILSATVLLPKSETWISKSNTGTEILGLKVFPQY